MKIRTATAQEIEWISQIDPHPGRSKQPIRLRVEAIEDEIAVFEDCCDGGMGTRCAIVVQVRSAITNTQLAAPEKKFRHAHRDGAVYAWKIEG
jgi:hypothetical protein